MPERINSKVVQTQIYLYFILAKYYVQNLSLIHICCEEVTSNVVLPTGLLGFSFSFCRFPNFLIKLSNSPLLLIFCKLYFLTSELKVFYITQKNRVNDNPTSVICNFRSVNVNCRSVGSRLSATHRITVYRSYIS